jgi:hypothetical protein
MARVPRQVPQVTIKAPWWAETETATIRGYIGGYDKKRIAAAGYKVLANASSPQQAGVELQMHEGELTKLELGLIGWTLQYDDGTAIPCDREHMALLDERDQTFILDQLTEQWSRWSAPAQTEDGAARPTSDGSAPVVPHAEAAGSHDRRQETEERKDAGRRVQAERA